MPAKKKINKKNTLYRYFLTYRTVEAEIKYKKYKNKLTTIMRTCKKEYYPKKLEFNKKNTKGIWTILNSVIRNIPRQVNNPVVFSENDNNIYVMEKVVNQFNSYFDNIGPKLPDEIHATQITGCNMGIKRNTGTMFIKPVL